MSTISPSRTHPRSHSPSRGPSHPPIHGHADVDWRSYAAVYDVMAEANPAYRALVDDYRRFVGGLRLRPGDVLVDVGAGTGNYTLAAAEAWPQCHVLHVDADDGMNHRARAKRAATGLGNLEIRTAGIDAFDLPDESAALVTVVHSLYTFPDPYAAIAKLFRWLRPGGALFACDPGAPLDVGEWSRYVFRHMCADRGFARAALQLWRAREVIRQSRRIGRAVDAGTYWRHDASTFRAAFEQAGFEVAETRSVYRGVSDLVIAQKPVTVARMARLSGPFEAAV